MYAAANMVRAREPAASSCSVTRRTLRRLFISTRGTSPTCVRSAETCSPSAMSTTKSRCLAPPPKLKNISEKLFENLSTVRDDPLNKVGPRWRAPMSGAGRAAPTAVLGAQSARETSPDRDRTVHEAPVARAHLPKNNTLRRLRGALPRTPPGLPPWTPSPPRMVPTHARALAGLIEILDERACACFEQQPHDANTLALAARESWANSMVQCGEAMVILQIDRCPALQKQFQCALTSTQASCLEQGGASALRSFELALSQATFARFVVRVNVGVLASTCPPLSSQFETIVSTSASLQANFPTPRRFRKN